LDFIHSSLVLRSSVNWEEKEEKKICSFSLLIYLFKYNTKRQSNFFQCLLTVYLQVNLPKKRRITIKYWMTILSYFFFVLYKWSISLFCSIKSHENSVRCMNPRSFLVFSLPLSLYSTCQNQIRATIDQRQRCQWSKKLKLLLLVSYVKTRIYDKSKWFFF
jgi:hypothetical protein